MAARTRPLLLLPPRACAATACSAAVVVAAVPWAVAAGSSHARGKIVAALQFDTIGQIPLVTTQHPFVKMSETAGIFLPTLYRLVARNQLQRPAALFPGQSGEVAERLLASGTVAEFREELLKWGMSNMALNANRMMLQRMLFLLMQNLMLEEERLGPQCTVPSKFKGDTSEVSVRKALTHTIMVLTQGTIWDLKNELQSWGLLHEHLNSGRMSLAIILRLSLRNLELSNLPLQNFPASLPQAAPACDATTPPKHQAESPATAPAAKRLCVDVSGNSTGFGQVHSISPVLLRAALNCASDISSNSQNDDASSPNSQSQSNCPSSTSTQPRCGSAQNDIDALPTCSASACSDGNSPTCSQSQSAAAEPGAAVAATS